MKPGERRANATKPSLGNWASIGPRVKALRIQLEMSMDDVAERANVSKATISRFERGFDTTFSAVVAVCSVVGLNFEAPECQHEYACKFCGVDQP